MDRKGLKELEIKMMEKWNAVNRLFEEYAKLVGLTPMSLAVLEVIYENHYFIR